MTFQDALKKLDDERERMLGEARDKHDAEVRGIAEYVYSERGRLVTAYARAEGVAERERLSKAAIDEAAKYPTDPEKLKAVLKLLAGS